MIYGVMLSPLWQRRKLTSLSLPTFWIIPVACLIYERESLVAEAKLAAERKIRKRPRPISRQSSRLPAGEMAALRQLCPATIPAWLISPRYSNIWNRNATVSVVNSNALITHSQCWLGRATIEQEGQSPPQAEPASPPLNGLGGQRSGGKRLFQSLPAKDAGCHQPPVKGLSQPRKRVGQSGGRHKRRPRSVSEYSTVNR
jgi:hypothetical protein